MTTLKERELSHSSPPYRALVQDAQAGVRSVVLEAADVLSRHVRLLVALPILVGAVAVLPSFFFGRDFKASASFMPEVSNTNAQRFAGLAAQFGITLGGTSGSTESLDSYVEIAQSRAILSDVVNQRYRLIESGLRIDTTLGTLLDIYHARGATTEERNLAAIKALRSKLSIRAAQKPGLITVETIARSRELAEAINRSVLDALSNFNLKKRQTRASAERVFVSDRLAKAQAEVQAAEGAVEAFLARNRAYQGSPQLMLEYSRLQRRLDLVQQVYTTLAQANEQARIEEVRNTPVITIIDRPEGSATYANSRRQQAMIGFVLGLVLAIAAAYGLEALRKLREREPERLATLQARLHLPRARRS